MDGRRAGPHPDTVASPLLDDLRVLQLQLLHGGKHDAVARFAGRRQRRRHLVICALCGSQLRQQLHEVAIVADMQPGALRQRAVKQLPGQTDLRLRHPLPQVDLLHIGRLHVLRRLQSGQVGRELADAVQRGGTGCNVLVQSRLDGMLAGQCVHPGRQEHIQLLQRELIEQPPQQLLHLPLLHGLAIYRQTADAEFLPDLLCKRGRP